MFKAAQINAEKRVVAISYLNTKIEHPLLIWLPDDAPAVMGTVWDDQAQTFTDKEAETPEIVYTLAGGGA